jgi:hypothetical protein
MSPTKLSVPCGPFGQDAMSGIGVYFPPVPPTEACPTDGGELALQADIPAEAHAIIAMKGSMSLRFIAPILPVNRWEVSARRALSPNGACDLRAPL